MDLLAWLRCFRIRRELESFLKRSRADSDDPVTLTLLRDGHCWTLVVDRYGQTLAYIQAMPGPRLVAYFRRGSLDGNYVISPRHPAHDAIFKLTAAARARMTDRDGPRYLDTDPN